jgi:DDE domain
MLSPKRDLIAARLFLRVALSASTAMPPRVINVDGHPAYASGIAKLKQSVELGWRCGYRTPPYLNNIIEQDHRFIKKRITASLGFRSADGAWRTIEGYGAMHAIRKGQIRWVAKVMSSVSVNSTTLYSVSLRRSDWRPALLAASRYLQQNRPKWLPDRRSANRFSAGAFPERERGRLPRRSTLSANLPCRFRDMGRRSRPAICGKHHDRLSGREAEG